MIFPLFCVLVKHRAYTQVHNIIEMVLDSKNGNYKKKQKLGLLAKMLIMVFRSFHSIDTINHYISTLRISTAAISMADVIDRDD